MKRIMLVTNRSSGGGDVCFRPGELELVVADGRVGSAPRLWTGLCSLPRTAQRRTGQRHRDNGYHQRRCGVVGCECYAVLQPDVCVWRCRRLPSYDPGEYGCWRT